MVILNIFCLAEKEIHKYLKKETVVLKENRHRKVDTRKIDNEKKKRILCDIAGLSALKKQDTGLEIYSVFQVTGGVFREYTEIQGM